MSDATDIAAALSRLRVATGFDVHPYAAGERLVLAGLEIEHTHGLSGHSDADVVAHAVIDALLGASGSDDDIGTIYPPSDEQYRGADSMQLLRDAWAPIRSAGWQLVNLDVTVIAEAPRLAPYRARMRAALADDLGTEPARVTIRATTTDGQGFVGRGEGVACIATCLLLAQA